MKSAPCDIGDELPPGRGRVNRAADALVRLALFCAFRLARLWWRFRRPAHRGALVALWHEGRILVVQSSYRRQWSLPGGGIDPGESPEAAARRELVEELGIVLPEGALALARRDIRYWEGRDDETSIFEAETAGRPRPRPDNREIVAAVLMSPEEALARPLVPHLAAYLRDRGVVGDGA